MAVASRELIALRPTVAPRLPSSPIEIDQRFMDEFIRILRLYFNEVDNFNGAISSGQGGKFLSAPYGAFQSTQTQSVSVINTPTRVSLNVTDFANDTYFVAGDGIHVNSAGIYNIQFSCQLTNTDNQTHDMDIWLRKGVGSGTAVDIANTASVQSVSSTHGGQPGYGVLAANFYVQLDAGDYIEFWWASNSLQVQMNYLPAITTPFISPGAPSFVVTITFVSRVAT
jgi:hypothetical protein